MNQVYLKGIAQKDARAGVAKTGSGWWVVDIQPDAESASIPVWHFGDAPPPAKGDAVEAVGRLGWMKDREGGWTLRVVADDVKVTRARTNGRPVGAGPRRNTGGGVPRERRASEDDIQF